MSLFDQLVDEAIRGVPQFAPLRVVVEKELLQHDILREMSYAGFMHNLTFIGGTCLRTCYGSPRLSEDLDFTGGADFSRECLAELGTVLVKKLEVKYEYIRGQVFTISESEVQGARFKVSGASRKGAKAQRIPGGIER
jgi:predicted nucleotidyltransferase component of viral defense system